MVSVDLSKISYYLIAVLSDGRQVHLENVAENIAWEENEKELAVRLNLTIRDIPLRVGAYLRRSPSARLFICLQTGELGSRRFFAARFGNGSIRA